MSGHMAGAYSDDEPSPRPSRYTQDSSLVSSTQSKDNEAMQKHILQNFISRIIAAKSTVELVSHVPTPVQDRTRRILDQVLLAFAKKEAASLCLVEWRDALAKEHFSSIPELNAIRPPGMQISKMAQDTGELMDIDFSDALRDAKKTTLTQMINIKDREIEVLSGFCDPMKIAKQIERVWTSAVAEAYVSPEHAGLLSTKAAMVSLAKSTTSLGANLSFRMQESKRNRNEKKMKAKVAATGKLSGEKSEMASFIKEVLLRQQQSAKDKKSGKGPRGAGPSKTKNQTPKSKVGKKDPKIRKGKQGPSRDKQRKKR